MFDLCTVLAKRAERMTELKARTASIEARRALDESRTTTRAARVHRNAHP
jgi:hypothetical protein